MCFIGIIYIDSYYTAYLYALIHIDGLSGFVLKHLKQGWNDCKTAIDLDIRLIQGYYIKGKILQYLYNNIPSSLWSHFISDNSSDSSNISNNNVNINSGSDNNNNNNNNNNSYSKGDNKGSSGTADTTHTVVGVETEEEDKGNMLLRMATKDFLTGIYLYAL